MQLDVLQVLKRSFLFEGASDSEFERAISSVQPYTIEYEKGDFICSPEIFDKRLGFVVGGECTVLHKHDSHSDVRLRALRRTDTFGIISVFSSEEEYPTTIVATKRCSIVYIDRDDVYSLVENHPFIAKAVIEFFAGRMHFMNSKVATFSAPSVEQKMAQLIVAEARARNSMTIKLNKVKVAEEIGVGRASLYRTLSRFSDNGLIKIDNKYLQILDLDALERIKK